MTSHTEASHGKAKRMMDISWDSLYCAVGLIFYETGGLHPVHLGDR